MWPFASRQKPSPKKMGEGARQFDGATGGRLLESLTEMFSSYNDTNKLSLTTMRRRSRAASINDPYIAKFMRECEQNIIGANGPRLFSTHGNENLEQVIEDWWVRWCDDCDVTGKHNMTTIATMAVRAAARDGEFLIRPIVTEGGLKLQALDASRLDDYHNDSMRRIRQGVELGEMGNAIAYHLRTQIPNDSQLTTTRAMRVRLPAEDVLHGFVPLWDEQVRGLPWLHAVLLRLHHLNRYDEAAVVAARLGAAKMMFFTQSIDGHDADTVVADDMPTETEPGKGTVLPRGVGVESFDPTYPHAQYGDFSKAILRGIASGLNVSYGSISGDLSAANYSSMRVGSIAERDSWMALQSHFNRQLYRRVFRQALKIDLMRGAIRYRGQPLLLSDYETLVKHEFQFRRWDWVDPKADLDADLQAMTRGIKSPFDIAAKYGSDIRANLRDLATVRKYAEALGLDVDWTSASKTARPATENEPSKPKGEVNEGTN